MEKNMMIDDNEKVIEECGAIGITTFQAKPDGRHFAALQEKLASLSKTNSTSHRSFNM